MYVVYSNYNHNITYMYIYTVYILIYVYTRPDNTWFPEFAPEKTGKGSAGMA